MRARRPWTPEEDKVLSHHVEVNSKSQFHVLVPNII